MSAKKEERRKKILEGFFGTAKAKLKKDHGNDKKGATIERHPETIKLLIEKGIAEKV